MGKIFVVSDLHFQHMNILLLEKERSSFSSLTEHDNTLINNWNSVVSPEDVVFVLGDFIMGAAENVPNILDKLNGTIYLILGNHDTKRKIEYYENAGNVHVLGDHNIFYYKGTLFCMNHFPLEGDENGRHLETDGWEIATDIFKEHYDEAVYLYGHIHSNAPSEMVSRTYHVGVDTNNFYPVLLDDIVNMI